MSASAPAVPPMITRRPPLDDPRPQRGELAGREPRCVRVLPDQAVEGRPGLDPLGQVARRERDDRGLGAVLVREQVQLADDLGRVLGDDADDELVWSCRATATLDSATTAVPLTSWTVMLPPKVGGWAYSRYCLRDPVASSTGVPNRVRESTPPLIRSSPGHGGPGVLDVHGDREPGPGADVTLEQGAGRHGQARRPRRPPGPRAAARAAPGGPPRCRRSTRAERGLRRSGTRAPRPRTGGRSGYRRAYRPKSCTVRPGPACRRHRLVVAVRPRLSYDAGAPGPIAPP